MKTAKAVSYLLPALRRDHTKLLICSMPKLVPLFASPNGTSNIGIASRKLVAPEQQV